jgi:hypothetical protein
MGDRVVRFDCAAKNYATERVKPSSTAPSAKAVLSIVSSPAGDRLSVQEVWEMSPSEAEQALVRAAAVIPLLLARAVARPVEPSHPGAGDELLDAKAAAAVLKMHVKTLRDWTDCPFLVPRGRRKFYSRVGLQEWLADQRR